VVADEVAAGNLDDETDAMYSTYGIADEDQLLAQFERGDFGPVPADVNGPAFVRLFDASSALQIGTLGSRFVGHRPVDLLWRDQSTVLTASTDGIGEWQSRDGHFLGFLEDSAEVSIYAIDLSTDGSLVAGATAVDVSLWNAGGQLETFLESVSDPVDCVGFAPNSARLAVGSESGVVEIWDGSLGDHLRSLEGHTGSVTAVSFAADGDVLATASTDGKVRLWETAGWTLLGEMSDSSMLDVSGYVRFSRAGHTLAALAEAGRAVRLLELDLATLAARQKRPKTVHYTNAKVVLLGDAGVGKTGLGLVLAGQTFRATDSTHQRNVWLLSSESTEGATPERKETFLWDLAGQPGYRLLHQLHLGDVAVAVVVFDARNEVDPLAGVRHWARALAQAERRPEATPPGTIERILVAARMDRGGAKVNEHDLRKLRTDFALDRYVTTSAKEGEGIATLREEIEAAID
jgi:GTPase SAR1 family protein